MTDLDLLGLPNKFISYALVTWAAYFFIFMKAAAGQIKSFMIFDEVMVFLFITPIALASIFYLMKDFLNDFLKDTLKDTLSSNRNIFIR